ncbi:MAG: WbqC family protein [Mariniphaga sp.]
MDNPKETVLLSSAYLAPIQYFTKLIGYSEVQVEICESYLKQTYRNRTIILTANGPIQLSLPVTDGPGAKGPIRDIELSYDHQWQQIHWRGISSAYNNSPFFEYYADDLAPYYHEKRWKYLFDFNLEIQNTLFECLDIKKDIKFTDDYVPLGKVPETMEDMRHNIHPKPQKQSVDPHFSPKPYTQVFHEKFGFIPNLSILDLMFNEGPETVSNLRLCIR